MKSKWWLKVLYQLIFITIVILFIITIIKLPTHFIYRNASDETAKGVTIGDMKVDIAYDDFKKDVDEYIGTLLSGTFGRTKSKTEIWEILRNNLKRSMALLIPALSLSIVLGILKGMLISKKSRTMGINYNLLTTQILLAMPDIFIILMIQLLVITLSMKGIKTFPITASIKNSMHIKTLFLPVLTLTIIPLNYIARLTARAIDDVYSKDYIKTAIGKGASKLRILWVHVLKNALTDIFSASQSVISMLISSLVIVELLFAYNGITLVMFNYLERREYNAVVSAAIIMFFIYIFLDLVFKGLKYLLIPKRTV